MRRRTWWNGSKPPFLCRRHLAHLQAKPEGAESLGGRHAPVCSAGKADAVDHRNGIVQGSATAARLQPGPLRPRRVGVAVPPRDGGRPLQRPWRHDGGRRTGGVDALQGAKPIRLRQEDYSRARMAFVSASWPSSEGSRLRAIASRWMSRSGKLLSTDSPGTCAHPRADQDPVAPPRPRALLRGTLSPASWPVRPRWRPPTCPPHSTPYLVCVLGPRSLRTAQRGRG